MIVHKVLHDKDDLPLSREDIMLFNVKLYCPKYVFLAFTDSQIHVSIMVSKTASAGSVGLEFCWICSRIFHGQH